MHPLGRNEVICVVDDDLQMRQSLCVLLTGKGYLTKSFQSAQEFVDWFMSAALACDLILSDCTMPGLSGYDLCRKVRALPAPERIPIILMTGSEEGEEQRAIGIEAGADDFVRKPLQSRELLAKIASLLEIRSQEIVILSELGSARKQNEALSERLERQNLRAQRLGRLVKYVSPNVADLVTSGAEEGVVPPHRAEVTVMFIDLRGFTRFSSLAEPDEVMEVLGEYYRIVGGIALKHRGTLGHLAGDGVMVFLNDPESIDRHQKVATEMAITIRDALSATRNRWFDRGHEIGFGIGLADGMATIGSIGFERFWQYSVIGPVSNLAARLCQAARHSQT